MSQNQPTPDGGYKRKNEARTEKAEAAKAEWDSLGIERGDRVTVNFNIADKETETVTGEFKSEDRTLGGTRKGVNIKDDMGKTHNIKFRAMNSCERA